MIARRTADGRVVFLKAAKNRLLYGTSALGDGRLKLPCGQCSGCRLARSREWAVRCEHEAQMHDQNCFVTLTFNVEALDERPTESVLKRDVQLFLKRLRKKFGEGIRVFYCGEYGDLYRRPHYHMILFNHDFGDKKLWKMTKLGDPLFRSEALERLWPYGYSSVAAATWETAAYVARYVVKKQDLEIRPGLTNGRYVSPRTGEILAPEFGDMSRRPGIGTLWLQKYQKDVYPEGVVVTRSGNLCKPPRFYDTHFEKTDPEAMEALRERRNQVALRREADGLEDRLRVREEVAVARVKRLVRVLED